MRIYAICKNHDCGYPSDQEQIKQSGIQIGDKIELEDASIGQSHSQVWLKGYSQSFNSVFFDFVDEDGNAYNIFKDVRFNPYIGRFTIQVFEEE